jgi:ATPase subunit of ABC transporter with duplicated ATPase domains
LEELNDYRPTLTKQVLTILSQGQSICIIGEVGAGKTHLAKLIQQQMKCCYAIYKGDEMSCLQKIAQDLGSIPVNEILKLRQTFTRRGLQTFSEMPDSRYYPTLQRFLFFNRRSGLGFTVSGNS